MVSSVLLVILFGFVSAEVEVLSGRECPPGQLAVYRLEFTTHWSRELFPKQYPEKRPPAQWSKLVGRTHDGNYALFREGELASKGLQLFAEKGETAGLEAQPLLQSQGQAIPDNYTASVLDEFNAPPISQGEGQSFATFFVDSNHSMVSAIVRIIPSPDWFVGVDSLQLCPDGEWLERVAVHGGPMDAGTDNGFTFTAPNWASEPKNVVEKIEARRPNHPANSFFYPNLQRLPTIATFRFVKERFYRIEDTPKKHSPKPDISNELAPPSGDNSVPVSDSVEVSSTSRPRRSKKTRRSGKPCRVGEWSEWSECSSSCGVGNAVRKRHVISPAKHGGKPCPPLEEHRWCGGQTNCAKNFFNWGRHR